MLKLKQRCAAAMGAVLFGCLALQALPAYAWDGVAVGTVSALDITTGSNYGFRVYLSGIANMCSGGPSWAYLNDSDSNYKIYVAALMMAKAQGTKVIVYSTLVGSYCHIGYVSVQPS